MLETKCNARRALAALLVLAGLARTASADISGDAVAEHTRVLAEEIGPRSRDGEASARAARYIEGRLRASGVTVSAKPVGRVTLPAISVGPLHFYEESVATVDDANILAHLGPRASAADPAILIMAHYDTVYASPGAVDNAVAVGIALELARSLARDPPARPVIIAFTAAEEHRLAGAYALAEELAGRGLVGLAVSVDMIGAPGRLSLNGLGPRMGRAWLEFLAETAERADVAIDAPVPHRVVSMMWPQIERSDHGAFTVRRVPALHLYTRTPSRTYLPYHTPWDTTDRVSSTSVAHAARFVEALVRRPGDLPRSDGDRGFWVPGTSWVVPRWLLVGAELMLAGWAIFTVVVLVRRGARAKYSSPQVGDHKGPSRATRVKGPGLLLLAGVYLASWAAIWLLESLARRLEGHPMPWVHAPGYAILVHTLAALSCAVLVLALVARWRTLAGRKRYLVAGLAGQLAIGLGLLALRVPELAWIPLLMAALASVLAWVGSRPLAWVIFIASTLPLALGPLDPGFLREAVFNGFFLPSVPLAGFLCITLGPSAAIGTYAWLRFGAPVRARIHAVVAALVLVAACALALGREPPCSGRAFAAYNLTCELPELTALEE